MHIGDSSYLILLLRARSGNLMKKGRIVANRDWDKQEGVETQKVRKVGLDFSIYKGQKMRKSF